MNCVHHVQDVRNDQFPTPPCDTNVISEVLRPRPEPQVVSWLESLSGDVAITAITLAELLAGVGRLPRGDRRSVLTTRIGTALQPYRDTRAVLAFDYGCRPLRDDPCRPGECRFADHHG